MSTTIRFDAAGRAACLYTEAVDLRALGRLQVVRATSIAFDPDEQRWEVRCAAFGKLLFADPSRAACLAWEQANLQPGATVPSNEPHPDYSRMKLQHVLPLLVACLMTACGPNKSELRSELNRIDSEMVSLRIAAEQHRAQMSEAEFDAFVGSFAAGYGAVSGDYGLAGDGVGTAVNATSQASAAHYSLDQIKQRSALLSKRRAEIIKDLN